MLTLSEALDIWTLQQHPDSCPQSPSFLQLQAKTLGCNPLGWIFCRWPMVRTTTQVSVKPIVRLKRYASEPATLKLSSKTLHSNRRGIQILMTPKYWCTWRNSLLQTWLVKMPVIRSGRLAPSHSLVNLAASYQNSLIKCIIAIPSATQGCQVLLRLIDANTFG